jgi:tripartite-type tricarboxylate transporter receptor subunit TctC
VRKVVLLRADRRRPSIPAVSAWALVLALALGAGALGCGRDERYPNRPITLISPWAAGGGTDRVARHLAVLLERDLGVPVNVLNATGGAGVTGHSRGALARPDGYTLTLLTVELDMLHWRGLTNISHRSFEPVALVNQDPAALLVRADARWRTLRELEEEIRRRPGALKASGTAKGGIWHVALAGWLASANMAADAVVWIPINGAAPSLQQLLAGGVDLVSCSLPEARTLLDGGQVRALGVMAPERLVPFPDVPTFGEQGHDWTLGAWRGIALPGGTPKPVVDAVVASLGRVLESQGFLGFMGDAGFSPARMLGPEFAAFLARDDAAMGALLTSPAFRHLGADRFGPLFFPGVVAGAMVLVLMALLVLGRRTSKAEPLAAEAPGATRPRRALEVMAAVIFFIVAAEVLGYLIAAATVLFVLLARLGVRWPTAALVTVVLVPATYQVFAIALRVPLPRGLFGW